MPSSPSVFESADTNRPLTNTSRGHDASSKSHRVRSSVVNAPLGGRIGPNVASAIGDGLVKCQSSFLVVGKPAAWKLAIARSRIAVNHAGPSGRVLLKCSTNAVLTSGSRSGFGGDPVVAALLELERQFLAAGSRDPAVNEHVDPVGHDVVQESLVVRDDQKRVIAAPKLVDAVGD